MIPSTQLQHWTGQFGKNYTDRNDLNIRGMEELSYQHFSKSLTQIYRELLQGIKIKTILEVGCNLGHQLAILQKLDHYQLTGVEPQFYALNKAKGRYPQISFVKGTIFNIPFANNNFDLVFTRGVLIHISPQDLQAGLREIYRVSKTYIAGLEYYAQKLTSVTYRGQKNLLWKTDYQKQYLRLFPQLKLIRSRLMKFNPQIYDRRDLFEQHFLLTKTKP